MPDLSKGTLLDPAWWQAKWKLVKGFFSTFFNGEWKENWNLGFNMIGQWFEEKFPNWSRYWEGAGAKWADALQPVRNALQKISDFFDTIAEKFEKSAWFRFFANAGSNLYDLQHENDVENDDTFMYTSKSGVTRPALKYNTDGSETELYKKYKSMYNEDGSETELNKRLQRSSYSLNQPNIPNLSQIMNATYQQPNTTIINNYTAPEKKEEKETVVEFSPTIFIDGRKITATVVDNINTMTRSSGKSPLIELGG
jgi:hypothetical protein